MNRNEDSFASRESLEALEFRSLLSLVAEGAATDVGRRRVLELVPSTSSRELSSSIERGREVERLTEDGVLVELLDDPVLPLFETLGEGRVETEGRDLVQVRTLLRSTSAAARRILDADPPCRELTSLVESLPDLSALRERLGKALDDRGRVRDEASPRLASLRRRSQKARQAAYGKLEQYVRQHGDELAEDTVPLHEDRLVVMLNSGSKGRLSGLIHGRSGSGQSFYFEPLEVVEANNELKSVQEEEEAERRRILRELVDETCQQLDKLRSHLDLLGELDLRQAAAIWGGRCDGLWIEPVAGADYQLVRARHPLLDPRLASLRKRALGQAGHSDAVEPLSVELAGEGRVLVITGPNAGGKTVALKTMGLLAVGAHCGLPIPVAAGTQIPALERVVASVGDEQDLLTDRSTFSGRLLRLHEAWNAAAPTALILLDELGSGTDPEEGAALGVALIEELAGRGALAAISSHLTRVAAAALDLDGAACAAMAFDTEGGRPTYRLLPGAPGGSEAIALARRLDLPAAWIDRAETLLGPDHGRLQTLLTEVESVRTELASELQAVAAERSRLERDRSALEDLRTELETARANAARDARQELAEFRREVKLRLKNEVERLKEEIAGGRRRGLAIEATERLFEESPIPEPEKSSRPIEVGGRVEHRGLGWVGTVSKLERGKAEVSVGGKRIICPVSELDGVEAESSQVDPMKKKASVSLPMGDVPASELHLRGQRVEEALENLDVYLDRSLLAGVGEVRVVHGHGTGRLKAAIREALDSHPGVARWRAGSRREGGDGATIVRLTG